MAGNDDGEVDVAPENSDVLENGSGDFEKAERTINLPMSRIKQIMKMDPEMTMVSTDASIMVAKAAELFIQDLSKEAYYHTMNSKRKTVQKKDLDLAIDRVDELAFLEGTL